MTSKRIAPIHLQDVITANTSTADNLLLEKLSTINIDARRILWVFSAVYEPITQTTMQEILIQLDWKTDTGVKLKDIMAAPLREHFLKQKFLLSSNGRLHCENAIAEVLAREAQTHGVFAEIAKVTARVVPIKITLSYQYHFTHPSTVLPASRSLREALYLHQKVDTEGQWHPLFEDIEDRYAKLFEFCFTSFDPDWFGTLPETVRNDILIHGFSERESKNVRTIYYAYLEELYKLGMLNAAPLLLNRLAEHHIERGQLDNIETLLPTNQHWQTLTSRALLTCINGDFAAALPVFETAYKNLRKEKNTRTSLLPGLPGVCFLLALVNSDNKAHRALLKSLFKSAKRGQRYGDDDECYAVIDALSQVLTGGHQKESFMMLDEDSYFSNNLAQLLVCLAWHWLGDKPTKDMLEELALNVFDAEDMDAWYLVQSLALLAHYHYQGPRHTSIHALRKRSANITGFAPVLNLIQPKASWELALNALNLLEPNRKPQASSDTSSLRLIWALELDHGQESLTPKEQKQNKKGSWSRGRNVALKRLHESPEELPYLSEADKQICKNIISGYGYRGYLEYELLFINALRAASNHPHIYWAGRYENPIEIINSEPELIVKEKNKQLLIQLNPTPHDTDSKTHLAKESDYRLRLVQFSEQHLQIARILGETGITVPIDAKEQALKSINAIAPLLAIHSDIGGGNIDAHEQAPCRRLFMQIETQNAGLKFELSVRPLGQDGPQMEPGEGRRIVMAEVNGERLQTQRDFAYEKTRYQQLLDCCPSLAEDAWDDMACTWTLDEEQSLELLFQLQTFSQNETPEQIAEDEDEQRGLDEETQTEGLQLLWPKGGRIKLGKEASLAQMKATVRDAGDWFELEGSLQLEDGEILAMGTLMELMQNTQSRFVKLNDDTFISLTGELRKRLDSLRKHGTKQQYHPLALGALDELTDGMDFTGDQPWQAQKERIQEAYALQPQVPATLQAELRDYQFEGFSWLSRLAHWGAGACLADDMGLGKTIQSLALILTRAAQGPSLILAPTSVCMNWLAEAARFAPTLKVHRFGTIDRQKSLHNAGPFDLFVCSYGLLQTEQTLLQSVHWQCIVADEAQALKNANTKRSKAAMALNAEFKMVTTGTPIENHLGELWTLFRFINPGLLGSLESFNSRFANPIQNQQDKLAKLHLKRLVQPFILRRLKAEVLPELPSRTEITIHVSPSKEERMFYESLRRKALQNLSENKGNGGQQQLRVLAEIMRLRRACCHPKLVLANSAIASSKLEAFGEILTELMDNNHRALVFSQFVDHLSILREYLDERNIHYQYLDGSTSIKKRERAVNAFQNGEGDVFLISLKAGGSGLNLTAADYVVHMDPWWNPAVEDQASDRAHRLGQKRPVTIYRLVTENTIEQKIIALHGKKRDLADSLLEGSDVSGKLSVKEIMGLIEDV